MIGHKDKIFCEHFSDRVKGRISVRSPADSMSKLFWYEIEAFLLIHHAKSVPGILTI